MTSRVAAVFRSVVRFGLKFVAAVALLVLVGYALTEYYEHPVKAFCAQLSADATPASVIAQAQERALPAYDMMKERGVVSVLNHKSPYFRFACDVGFENGHLVSKSVIDAD